MEQRFFSKRYYQAIIAVLSFLAIILGQNILIKELTDFSFSRQLFGLTNILIFYLFLLLLFPLLIIRYIYREKTEEFFLNFFPEDGFWFDLSISLALIIFLGLIGWRIDWLKFLPVSPFVEGNFWSLLVYLILFLPWIAFCQEFFFRGFLLASLNRSLGIFWAIVGSGLMAIFFEQKFFPWENGNGWKIIALLLPVTLISSWAALKNRSILIPILISLLIRYSIDGFVFYKIYLMTK